MRFVHNKEKPKVGDVKTVRRFIICKTLPNKYGNMETRCLEWSCIEKEYQTWADLSPDINGSIDVIGWRNARWAD